MNPNLVIFSSSRAYAVAEGIQDNLKKDFTAHLWKDFFGENKAIPIWAFFKKLFCYDFAVIVLADDEIVKADDNHPGETEFIPKDNVIFELGAVMARLGPQKTFMVTPKQPKVRVPGYFKDVMPMILEYDNSLAENGSYVKATADVCNAIRSKLNQVDKHTFHSDLPAQGLAFGYTSNFILPVYFGKEEQLIEINKTKNKWKKESGKTITVVIPDVIINRNGADDFLLKKHTCFNTQFKLNRERDMSVYALERGSENSPLHILDIPTTLLTSSDIVGRIESFWRAKDEVSLKNVDEEFKKQLSEREILNFRRMLEEVIDIKGLNRSVIFIRQSSEVEEHLEMLKNYNPPVTE